MMSSRLRSLARRSGPFAIAAAIQIGLLGWMIGDRALILARGTEIELEVEPVDPHDPLRGEYVQLRYAISELDRAKLPADATVDWPEREPNGRSHPMNVWIELERSESGNARVVSVHATRPQTMPGVVVVAGKTTRCTWDASRKAADCSRLHVNYDIERFYVPEGEGKKIEAARTAKRVTVVAAVSPDGRAAIKRLLIDGKPVYDEPAL